MNFHLAEEAEQRQKLENGIHGTMECEADGYLLVPRVDYSAIRGKNTLVSPTEEQFELLRQRLEDRTQDSRGETIFEIGVGEGKFFLVCLAKI